MAALLLLYNGLRVVDVLALGWFRPASEVGGYAALAGVAYLITVPGQALSQTLAPAVARLHAAGDVAGARTELRGYLRRAGLFSAPLFAGVAAFGPWLDLLFGARYAFAPGLCLTLATAFLVGGCLGPMAASLTMTGRHRQEVAVLLAGAAATVGLCGLLIPRFGGEGAALAVLAGYLLVNGARAALSARVLGGLDVRPADFAAPVACLAVALAWRAVLQGFCPHDWPTAIWGAGVLLSGFAGLYAGVLLNPQERTALFTLLGLARRRAAA
jgi:O-antigen/teichoic acid export membrane protein